MLFRSPQSASGFAVVGVAVQLVMAQGKCQDACIGVTGLAPKAYRATSTENALKGKALDEATLRAAVAQADADIKGAASDASYALERLVLTITALRQR